MNENLYIAHKKLPHKTLRVHSARYTQCIHVSSRKLKLPKDTHTKRYKQLLPTHPFPKVELYIAVKCKNIYRVTNNDNNNNKKQREKKSHTHTMVEYNGSPYFGVAKDVDFDEGQIHTLSKNAVHNLFLAEKVQRQVYLIPIS